MENVSESYTYKTHACYRLAQVLAEREELDRRFGPAPCKAKVGAAAGIIAGIAAATVPNRVAERW